MSFVDLLFPLEELEALGNKWEEPAAKKRKIDLSAWNGQHRALAVPRRQNSESAIDRRRPRLSPSSHPQTKTSSTVPSNVGGVKRANSESNTSTTATVNTPAPATTADTTPVNSKSGFPSFIEPSILKTYLHHLHPNDRPRYSLPGGHRPDNQSRKDMRTAVPQTESEDAVYSPGSLTDTSSPSSSDNCPTPSAGISDQFRSGPFGHLFDGMRITEHERDLMEDLLNPSVSIDFQGPKAKEPEADLASEDFYKIDERLLQRMFPTVGNTTLDLSYKNSGYAYADKDVEVHSSGLSPAAEDEDEEDKISPAGIVMYDYSALSVDDFFDLDEASATTSLATK